MNQRKDDTVIVLEVSTRILSGRPFNLTNLEKYRKIHILLSEFQNMGHEALQYKSDNDPRAGNSEFSRYPDVQNNEEIVALGLQEQIRKLEVFYWPIRRACLKVEMDDYEEIERLKERLVQAEAVFNDFNRLICSLGCTQELLDLFKNAYILGFRNMCGKLYSDSVQSCTQINVKSESATPVEEIVPEPEKSFIRRNRVLIAVCVAIVIAGGSFLLHSRNDSKNSQELIDAISIKND